MTQSAEAKPVFISYARSTAAEAQAVAEQLRALGYAVWFDEQLPAHRAYGDVIEEQLRAAKAVVVIWSAEAVKSEWVRSEANRAREEHKLVQLSVDGTALPMPFDQIQCADLNGWSGDINAPGWRKVVASVAELAETFRSMPHAMPATNASAAARRNRMVAAAIAALIVLGGAATYLFRSHAPEDSAPTAASATNGIETSVIPGFGSRPAIAVLPFDNFSPDPEQAFFADGLAEDLITRLSSWRAFPVIARNSSFKYRGGNLDLKKVSDELGARYLVEGSVRRDGDRIRITAQLIDAPAGEHLWAEKYDREVKDIFALQDEISSTIAASLVGDLTRVEGERARQRGPENLDAWSLYELGMQRFNRFNAEDMAAARQLFEQAAARDPHFSTAQAYVAYALVWENNLSKSDVPQEKTLAAVASARRAVDLDPNDALAHVALSFALLVANDPPNALTFAQRSVELNPSLPDAWAMLGMAKWQITDDPVAALPLFQEVLRLDPQGPVAPLNLDNMSVVYWEMGDYEDGLDAGRRVAAALPRYWGGYVDIAMNAVALGRMDEAKAAIIAGRAVQPNLSLDLVQRGYFVSRPEIDARRNATLRQAGLE